MRALLATVLALLSAVVVSGCGSTDSHQVGAKVQQFVHAVAARDATTICKQVLAPSLSNRFAVQGLSCEQGMKIFLASVQDPTLSIGRITVKRNQAEALVLAGAHCQRVALAQLHLVKISAGWRIDSEGKVPAGKPTC
ncbi:MAG: hypothetical protein JO023_00535 [Chloroflexi bacterium]|nr:hypothetical protein [Chloroflexota bacterium]